MECIINSKSLESMILRENKDLVDFGFIESLDLAKRDAVKHSKFSNQKPRDYVEQLNEMSTTHLEICDEFLSKEHTNFGLSHKAKAVALQYGIKLFKQLIQTSKTPTLSKYQIPVNNSFKLIEYHV